MENNADQAQAKRSQVSGLHILSVSGPHFLSDEIQKISFSQSSFMKNMRFQKDTASAKSLNPIFSVMKF